MLPYFRHLNGRRSALSIALLMGLMMAGVVTAEAAKKSRGRVITRPQFDPAAERVALFTGMDAGQLEARIVAENSLGGSLRITNNTDQPLTVELPKAFVAVQVSRQGFGGGGGGFDDGGGGAGGGGGGGQATGGGGGGGLGGGQGGGGGGGGFFSVPPERTVSVPYNSVCLEHGKAEPNRRMRYVPVPMDSFTTDPIVHELLTMVSTGRVSKAATQAAAWKLANNMSWAELGAKTVKKNGQRVPYFQVSQLRHAEVLLATAKGRVREKAAEETSEKSNETITEPSIPSRVR